LLTCSKEKSINSVEINSIVDTLQTTIGEPIYYTLNVNHSDTIIIQFPDWEFDNFLELRNLSTKNENNKTVARLEIVFWDTGLISIPELNINFLNRDSTLAYSMKSDSLGIEVVSIKDKNPSLTDISDDILPIKEPVPINLSMPLALIIQVVLLVILLFGIILLWRKRVSAAVPIGNHSKRAENPAHIAMKKLDELRKFDLDQENHKKEFYIQLSFILREYLENSFFIRTLEMTTQEIDSNRNIIPFETDLIDKLIKVLSMADLVKYAKYDKNSDKCFSDLEDAAFIIEASSNILI